MSTMRTYGDACGVARALDVVGERWALMIVRELLLGPKRFTDIRTGLPNLSADVLAQRLRELDAAGVIRRRTLPPPAASQVYELTPSGLALEPVIAALGRWGGANGPALVDGVGMSLDSHVISFRTLFDPALAGDLHARVALHFGDQRFRAVVAGGTFTIERGEADGADAVIEGDPTAVLDVAHGRRTLAAAQRAGAIRITGDEAVVARFLGLFPIPAPAA